MTVFVNSDGYYRHLTTLYIDSFENYRPIAVSRNSFPSLDVPFAKHTVNCSTARKVDYSTDKRTDSDMRLLHIHINRLELCFCVLGAGPYSDAIDFTVDRLIYYVLFNVHIKN